MNARLSSENIENIQARYTIDERIQRELDIDIIEEQNDSDTIDDGVE